MGEIKNLKIARKGDALFITLYLREFSASLADGWLHDFSRKINLTEAESVIG